MFHNPDAVSPRSHLADMFKDGTVDLVTGETLIYKGGKENLAGAQSLQDKNSADNPLLTKGQSTSAVPTNHAPMHSLACDWHVNDVSILYWTRSTRGRVLKPGPGDRVWVGETGGAGAELGRCPGGSLEKGRPWRLRGGNGGCGGARARL